MQFESKYTQQQVEQLLMADILPAEMDFAVFPGKSEQENPLIKISLTKLHCKYWIEFGEIGQIRKKGRIQEFVDKKMKKGKKGPKKEKQKHTWFSDGG